MRSGRVASTRELRSLSRLRGRHRRPTAAVLDQERRCEASAMGGGAAASHTVRVEGVFPHPYRILRMRYDLPRKRER
jgi:hypothetical protein